MANYVKFKQGLKKDFNTTNQPLTNGMIYFVIDENNHGSIYYDTIVDGKKATKNGTVHRVKFSGLPIKITGSVIGTGVISQDGETIEINTSTNHSHGLAHQDFTVTLSNDDTNLKWTRLGNQNGGGFWLKSIRGQSKAPAWFLPDFSAGIAFGGADTKGIISVRYSQPGVRFAGGNGDAPVWYFTITGANDKTYDLSKIGGHSSDSAKLDHNVTFKIASTADATKGGSGTATNLSGSAVDLYLPTKISGFDLLQASRFQGNADTSTVAAKLGRGGNTSLPMTFNWNGQGGQPTWLWGGENGTDMYVYNPSNFRVAHSVNTAGLDHNITFKISKVADATIGETGITTKLTENAITFTIPSDLSGFNNIQSTRFQGTADNADTVDYFHVAEEKYKYETTKTQPTSGADWCIKISTPDWNSTSETIYLIASGNNTWGTVILKTGSRQNNWWGYATNYNGTGIIGVYKLVSNSDDVYIKVDGAYTSVRIRTTFNPRISIPTTIPDYKFTSVPYQGGFFSNAIYTDTLTFTTPKYWANIPISDSVKIDTQPTFNTAYVSNWWRSTGSTGWWNETHRGGITMEDDTYVKVAGNKSFLIPTGSLKVGESKSKFYANSSGDGYFSNTLGIAGINTNYNLYVNGQSAFENTLWVFKSSGTTAIFGGTVDNINDAIYAPTTGIQLCAAGGGATNSTAIGFHNPGISSAIFGYYQIDANNGQFRMRSDDFYWDLSLGGTTKLDSVWGKANLLVGEDGSDKIVAGYLTHYTNGAVIGAHNSTLTAWAPLNVSGTYVNIRRDETTVAKFLDGCLSLFPLYNDYREGIRIHSCGSWSDILLCGNDNTGDTGTSANSWFIGNNNGNFYLTRNGSTSSSAAILSCKDNYWEADKLFGVNGRNSTYNFYVNGTSGFEGNLIPNITLKYNLGATDNKWNEIFVGSINGLSANNFMYQQKITVYGNIDTYYPVRIECTYDKSRIHYITIFKDLGTKTAAYSGNHSNGTSSMWLIYEHRYTGWDGNGGYTKTLYYSMPYANLVANALSSTGANGDIVVWLRGGGTDYWIGTSYVTNNISIYYERTNLGYDPYNNYVEPTTTVINRGWDITSTYLGYGNIYAKSGTTTLYNLNITTNSGTWAYNRYMSGSSYWDIAVLDNDNSGGLQFKAFGGNINRTIIQNNGRWDIYSTQGANNSVCLWSNNAESSIAYKDKDGAYTSWTVGRGPGGIGSTFGWWNGFRNVMTLSNDGALTLRPGVSSDMIIGGRWLPGDPVVGNMDGNDRPGIRIYGDYPQLVLMSGRVGNAQHGATISLGGYDSSTALTGAHKHFTFGTPGYNVTWMDLVYSTSTNPHGGINNWNDSGYTNNRIMRFNSNRSVVHYGTVIIDNQSVYNNYDEGLRINYSPNKWAGIVLGGDTGTVNGNANGWFVANYNGTLYNSWAGSSEAVYRTQFDNTGHFKIYGTPNDGNPILELNAQSSPATWGFGWVVKNPNLEVGQNIYCPLGVSYSSRNMIGLDFNYAGFGSTSNFLGIEVFNMGNAFRFYADLHTSAHGRLDACNRSNSASYMESALQIRERGFGGAQDDTWATAPRLSWHWSGRVQAQIGLASDGWLYMSRDGSFGDAYRLVTERTDFTWNISSHMLDGYHASSFFIQDRLAATNTAGDDGLWGLTGNRSFHGALPDGLSNIYSWGQLISFSTDNAARFQIYAAHMGSTDSTLSYRTGWGTDKRAWRTFIDSGNIGKQSVNYAASAGNADTIDGYHAADLFSGGYKTTLDLSTLNNNLYYPVTGTSLPHNGYHKIKVSVQLDSGTKPSWATHDQGFTTNVELYTTAYGWGTTQGETIVLNDSYNFTNCGQVVGFTQNGNNSTPVLWLRGGGKYFVECDYNASWTVRTSLYYTYGSASDTYKQTVEPQSSYPGFKAGNGGDVNGVIRAGQVYGAVWNDYAEYRKTKEYIQPGYCVIETGNGDLIKSSERLQPGANIVSDTFGFAIGETEQTKTPLAVSGRVLAYPYEDRDSYQAGDPVCSGPNGTISKMTREEVRGYPDRIIGTVSEIPDYEVWGTGNVKVNNRIWIKVK